MVSLQGIFEGLKAYRTEDGRILLFRPEENALRMKVGADRLCMPSPSVEQFVDAVTQTVIANKRWVCISSYLSFVDFSVYQLHIWF
jgi:branched-chain amino acid aminotransferase